ncbi:class I SAM-dependent methyltransferase [Halorarum salinum]|uniref:Class I SAM-dependent methyltransferase n=1 Tax=Halorarum salinum TaxID=2743089 RepID=A0A7D5LAF7_9EURY|nr:class I SAM-dependent methyltransferase [Halobaculum salinum]QLG61810.1 class I SAM-dependent methyltransferase [Halobaculum salinum]
MSDPFGRAIRDFHRGEQDEPLRQFDGDESLDHPIEDFYFGEVDPEDERTRWLESRLSGRFLDLGAGAGRDSLYFQDRLETVSLEVSEHLVGTMRERGVDDARLGDMFALPEQFERGRFGSVLAYGTQLALVRSMRGLREFLGDLARVTTDDATAILDNYDPEYEGARELLGYRHDPTPGLGFRVMHFEYEGDVGDTLLFRLFSSDRLRDACVGTGWTLDGVSRGAVGNECHYMAVLEKE